MEPPPAGTGARACPDADLLYLRCLTIHTPLHSPPPPPSHNPHPAMEPPVLELTPPSSILLLPHLRHGPPALELTPISSTSAPRAPPCPHPPILPPPIELLTAAGGSELERAWNGAAIPSANPRSPNNTRAAAAATSLHHLLHRAAGLTAASPLSSSATSRAPTPTPTWAASSRNPPASASQG
uniref:Uncharacterized protein n=1 Tax=Setaria viridis TaxID=4556 RepID=A0A4U6T4V9_SETVI|nr:hypothetical protein SEVIR_9G447801v2 [Setaria viridis]